MVQNEPHFNITTASFVYGQSSFGGEEVNDALNAVRFFENQNRSLILWGTSHGAYLSLMTGTMVNCTAIFSLAGPSDLVTMEEFSLGHLYLPILFSPLIKMTADECSGIPSQIPFCYQKRSPAYRADLMNCPVLLFHGIDDNIVPSSQSITMANSLNSSNKPYQLILTNSTHLGIEQDPIVWEHICKFVSNFGIGCEVTP